MADREHRGQLWRAREAKQAFVPALRTVWPYSLSGIIAGALLIVLTKLPAFSFYRKWSDSVTDPISSLTEHLGAGFFVSAVAVFLYEWGSEAKKLVKLVHEFNETTRPIVSAIGRDAIRKALKTIAPEFEEPYLEILEAATDLKNRGDSNNALYLQFVRSCLARVASVVRQAADFSVHLREDPRSLNDLPMEWPSASAVAALVLAAKMDELSDGDSYRSLSSVGAWNTGLEPFRRAQERAVVGRGVEVKRVFLAPKRATGSTGSTIAQHWKYAAMWTKRSGQNGKEGRYTLRVTTTEEFERIVPDIRTETHFGIFRKQAEDGSPRGLAVQVLSDDLSRLRLRAAPDDGPLASDYERLWAALDTTYAGRHAARIASILLTSEAAALTGGKFDIVSDFESWTDSKLDDFHQECLKAIRTRGCMGRRIFVLQSTDDKKFARTLLAKHLANMKEVHKRYCIRVTNESVARSTLGDLWQFGLFTRPELEPEKVGFMVGGRPSPTNADDFYMLTVDVPDRAEKFEHLWKSLPANESVSDWLAKA